MILSQSQPSLAEVGAGVEPGNDYLTTQITMVHLLLLVASLVSCERSTNNKALCEMGEGWCHSWRVNDSDVVLQCADYARH